MTTTTIELNFLNFCRFSQNAFPLLFFEILFLFLRIIFKHIKNSIWRLSRKFKKIPRNFKISQIFTDTQPFNAARLYSENPYLLRRYPGITTTQRQSRKQQKRTTTMTTTTIELKLLNFCRFSQNTFSLLFFQILFLFLTIIFKHIKNSI